MPIIRSKAQRSLLVKMESQTQEGDNTDLNTDEKFFKLYWNFASPDSRVIIWLLYACERIPGEVLGLLYAAANTSRPFSKSMYLVSKFPRHLKLERVTTDWQSWVDRGRDNESLTWRLEYTLRDYMDKHKDGQEEIRSLLGALLGDQETKVTETEKRRVVIALCALYFDRTHKDKVVRDAATRAITICSVIDENHITPIDTVGLDFLGPELVDKRQKAMEPIIWLLAQPVNNERGWTESNIRCARNVFLKYICESKLDYANFFILLRLDSFHSVQLATLRAIYHIYSIERASLLTGDHLSSFLVVLSDLLKLSPDQGEDQIGSNSVKEAAFDVLASISFLFRNAKNEQSMAVVVNTPGILTALVNSLQDSTAERSFLVTDRAIQTLRNLSFVKGESKLKIWKAGAILGLVRLLSKDDSPDWQKNAAGTLAMLSVRAEPIIPRIIKKGRALAGPGILRFQDKVRGNANLEYYASAALGNLANYRQSIILQYLREDGSCGICQVFVQIKQS